MLNIETLSKIDLHCHLDGSLSVPMMEKQLHHTILPEEICVDETCHSLTEYLKKFDIPLQCLQTQKHLIEQAYSFMKQLTSDNTNHIEVRFAPMLSVRDGLTCSQVIESVLKGLELGKQETGISYNVITCTMRHFCLEKNMQLLDCAEKFSGKGVCAIDLAGDESRYPNTLFKELFEEALHRHIPFTIHSGETGNIDNVRTAVEYGASRIGHGLALIQDPDLMQEIASRKIGIEMCPTSNVQTKAVQSLAEYPLKEFVAAGVKVCINTDNRTVSRTNMTQELNTIWTLYQDETLIEQLLVNAAEIAF